MEYKVRSKIQDVLLEDGIILAEPNHKIATDICERLKRNLLEDDEVELVRLALVFLRHQSIDALAVHARNHDEKLCETISKQLEDTKKLEKKLKGR